MKILKLDIVFCSISVFVILSCIHIQPMNKVFGVFVI